MRHIREFLRDRLGLCPAEPRRLGYDGQDVIERFPRTHQEAAARLAEPSTVKSPKHKALVLKVDPGDSDPRIIDFAKHFQKTLERRMIPFYVFAYQRGEAEQNRLFSEGRTRAKWGESPHNFGAAVDLVHSTRHWDLHEMEWAIVGAIGKEVARRRNINVTWGGDWKFYDPAHWELTDWRSLR